MQSDAKTVDEYLSELDDDRRERNPLCAASSWTTCRTATRRRCSTGMITYIVPLSVLADTYNGQPLMYVPWRPEAVHVAFPHQRVRR